MDTYHWGILVTYHWDVGGCFIWNLFETSWRSTDGTFLSRSLETSSRCSNKTSRRRTTETSWRRSMEASLGVSFETYLRHYWDEKRDVFTTSLRRFVARWVVCLLYISTISFFLTGNPVNYYTWFKTNSRKLL